MDSDFFWDPILSSDGKVLYTSSGMTNVGPGGGSLVIALNPADGTKLWAYKLPDDPVEGSGQSVDGLSISPDGDTLFVSSQYAYAFNTADGSQKWNRNLGESFLFFGDPCVYDKTAFFICTDVHPIPMVSYVQAFNAADGSDVWSFTLPGPNTNYFLSLIPAIASNEETLFAGVSNDDFSDDTLVAITATQS